MDGFERSLTADEQWSGASITTAEHGEEKPAQRSRLFVMWIENGFWPSPHTQTGQAVLSHPAFQFMVLMDWLRHSTQGFGRVAPAAQACSPAHPATAGRTISFGLRCFARRLAKTADRIEFTCLCVSRRVTVCSFSSSCFPPGGIAPAQLLSVTGPKVMARSGTFTLRFKCALRRTSAGFSRLWTTDRRCCQPVRVCDVSRLKPALRGGCMKGGATEIKRRPG